MVHEPIAAELLGSAEITPSGAFEAGSTVSFTLTYTAGLHGIDDSGSLKIVSRFASDQTRPQFEDPAAGICKRQAVPIAKRQLAALVLRTHPNGIIEVPLGCSRGLAEQDKSRRAIDPVLGWLGVPRYGLLNGHGVTLENVLRRSRHQEPPRFHGKPMGNKRELA